MQHAKERMLDNGIEITVTGTGRTLPAIKRMVPSHVRKPRRPWLERLDRGDPGRRQLTVLANGAVGLAMLKGLGFMGIMVQGAHHQPHHLMMAKGEMAVR